MRRPTLLAAAVLGLVLVGCAGGGAGPTDAGGGAEAEPPAASGDVLPDRVLPVLGEDRELATAELRGRPTVINFWATWCAFCVEEMPDLQAAHERLGEQVRFLGVDVEDVADRALEFVADTGVTYDSVEDVDRGFFTAVEGRGMPTTLLVDADGVIRYRHTGPLTTQQLLDLVEEHLGVTP